MLEGIAMFTKTMMGIWNSVKAGIAVGNLMSGDADDAFNNLIQVAHINGWADVINHGGLNSGQLSMANMCQDAGSDFLEGMNFANWDPEQYIRVCMGAADGAAQALGHSIEQVSMGITHAANSTASGITSWGNGLSMDWE